MARPAGVTVLAILSFFAAGMNLLIAYAAVATLLGVPQLFAYAVVGRGNRMMLAASLYLLVSTPLFLINGIGLLQLRNWARVLSSILIGSRLLDVLMHTRSWFVFVFNATITICILAYLFKPQVKQAFGATGP